MVVEEKMAWTVPKSCTNVVSVATDELTAATNNEAGGLGRKTPRTISIQYELR